MIKQENCPICDWKIDWTKVKKNGTAKNCPMCGTRLVGKMKECTGCGELSSVDAFYCMHCRQNFPIVMG